MKAGLKTQIISQTNLQREDALKLLDKRIEIYDKLKRFSYSIQCEHCSPIKELNVYYSPYNRPRIVIKIKSKRVFVKEVYLILEELCEYLDIPFDAPGENMWNASIDFYHDLLTISFYRGDQCKPITKKTIYDEVIGYDCG